MNVADSIFFGVSVEGRQSDQNVTENEYKSSVMAASSPFAMCVCVCVCVCVCECECECECV